MPSDSQQDKARKAALAAFERDNTSPEDIVAKTLITRVLDAWEKADPVLHEGQWYLPAHLDNVPKLSDKGMPIVAKLVEIIGAAQRDAITQGKRDGFNVIISTIPGPGGVEDVTGFAALLKEHYPGQAQDSKEAPYFKGKAEDMKNYIGAFREKLDDIFPNQAQGGAFQGRH